MENGKSGKMGTLFKKYDFSKRGFPKLEDTEFLLNLSVTDHRGMQFVALLHP